MARSQHIPNISIYAWADITYLEMQRYQREDESFEILHQIVENTEPFWVSRFRDIDKRSDLGSLIRILSKCANVVSVYGIAYLKRYMLVAQPYLQLLLSVLILLGPFGVVFPSLVLV